MPAQQLGTSRPNVARIDQQTDLLVSTLQRYVEAAGGRLDTKVVFPDGRELTS